MTKDGVTEATYDDWNGREDVLHTIAKGNHGLLTKLAREILDALDDQDGES